MVSGIRNTRTLVALAAMGLAGTSVLDAPIRRGSTRTDQERREREQRLHSERAWERKRRRQAADDLRERLLRERIAKGQDDRADKYLHASARRRRIAEANAPIVSGKD